MKCKVFWEEIEDMESQVNEFLEENSDVKVEYVTQSTSKRKDSRFIYLTIFYSYIK